MPLFRGGLVRRRRLLAAASAAIAAACVPTQVASSTVAPTATGATPPTSQPTASPSIRPSPDWAALRASLRGALVVPGAADYDTARLLYNTRFDGVRPNAIARCTGVEDVQACVRFARTSGVPLAVRSGGHSYIGASITTGLVIDLAALSTVTVETGRATIGGGAKLVDVYDALASRGVGIAAGSCPTVGIGGLTLGGGLGVLTRAWGLTCDQLIGADVVTADGALHHVDMTNEPDLFWALRGGGGSFGVATALTFATHAAADLALAFLSWPASATTAALRGWQTWMKDAPDALWSTLHLDGGGPNDVTIHAVSMTSAPQLAALLDVLVGMIGVTPSYRESGARAFRDVMLLEAGCLGRSVGECHVHGASADGVLERETYAAKSIVAPAALTQRAIATLVDRVYSANTGVAVLIDALGGAVARVAPDATAFPHRGAFATLQLYASWREGGNDSAPLAWLSDTHDSLRPLIGEGAYANYADGDLIAWEAAYYGTNYARLQDVKRRYDPDRLFNFTQAVAP